MISKKVHLEKLNQRKMGVGKISSTTIAKKKNTTQEIAPKSKSNEEFQKSVNFDFKNQLSQISISSNCTLYDFKNSKTSSCPRIHCNLYTDSNENFQPATSLLDSGATFSAMSSDEP